MTHGIRTVFLKELIDTLRDRKTLIFMLLVPTLLTPGLIFGIGSIAINILKQNALSPVVIAADERTQQLYRQMVFDEFLRSDVGKILKYTRSPLVAYFVGPGALNDMMKTVPPMALRDPVEFEKWTRAMTANAKETLVGDVQLGGAYDTISEFHANQSPANQDMMNRMGVALFDFYALTVRGLGLVDFVDPSRISTDAKYAVKDLPFALSQQADGAKIYGAIQSREIQGFMIINNDLSSLAERKDQTAEVIFYYDSTIALSNEANSRVHGVVDRASMGIVKERVQNQKLTPNFLTAVEMRKGTNLASRSQITMEALGGLLPYLFLTFAFLGAIYPAIDLGAGEKERNTLETLLLSPVTRTEIALGKFALIFSSSLVAALLGVLSMSLSFVYLVPKSVADQLEFHVDLMTGISVAMLAIPPAAAFAGLFLAVSIFARSFKEAQNYLSPMGLALILPAMAGMIPGLEMGWIEAAIPLVNVSMLSKEFLKGNIHWGYYAMTFGSCFAFAAVCLSYCIFQFRREEVLFRS
ncbi:ABC transporter permease [Candidatus Sumerlaeota bacterium]|nr:ABC transporter permease [Candidatus Sumerlaeota bacterium]